MAESVGQVAVVTGGSRGIGRGIVLELARLGFHLVIHSRTDGPAASETEAEALKLGAKSVYRVSADVADVAAGRAMVADIFRKYGRCNLWVNNAGIAPDVRMDLLEMTGESWDKVLGTNLRGPFFMTHAVAGELLKQRQRMPEVVPRIVFVTSVSSVMASVQRGEYCVSKAGLAMVAKLFAARLAAEGIVVTEVRPGIIETDMTAVVKQKYDGLIAGGLVPQRRWGRPEDVGRVVAAMARGDLDFSTGAVITVDGGLTIEQL
ncbi:MAG: 3-ketoacyl-ACP reductase [Isosphaeraceae bacterium]